MTTSPTTDATTAQGECAEVEAPAPKDVKFDAPERVLERGEPATATVETSCGSFEIELDTEELAEDGELVRLPRRAGLLRRHRGFTASSPAS